MLTSHVLMVRPVRFGYNAETAVNNAFQKTSNGDVQAEALLQFNAFVAKLRNCDINVTVIDDTPEPHTPDSIFPNNWISFHAGGTVCLYPMFAENRQQERKAFGEVKKKLPIKNIIDFTHYEKENKFLEGTGSMVFDRANKIAYACISPRMNEGVLNDFCQKMNFTPLAFHAVDTNGQAIYHTNVMMCVAEKYAVICMESVAEQERKKLIETFSKTNKEIVEISLAQMNQFAGNMLQIQSTKGKPFLIMSETAYNSLNPEQVAIVKKHNDIIYSDIHTIEINGGGSARCMIAEVFE